MKHVKRVVLFYCRDLWQVRTLLDKRAFMIYYLIQLNKLNQIYQKNPFLFNEGLTMNDHQTWSAIKRFCINLLNLDLFICRST